ncbi:MAG: hypothetical protein EAZ44_04455 [Cytophagia bacterium]|nr:MAG: hypothetical protein EAZ44_04455 [Cytophagia bacterium]TAG41503.1 MAG: hypothetical protein EAZ31_07445 [Cytophagia bacterium]TAH30315.1 MAG: hypothetical protein EAZ06_03615 [Cytophagales bacterium]
MGTLKIERPNQYLDFTRSYKILLDGKIAGKINNGETKEFIIPEGKHSIKAKIDGFASRACFVDIDDTIIKNIKVKPTYAIFIAVMIQNSSLALESLISIFFKINYFGFLYFPCLILLIIYIFTIGKNNHLIIEDLDKK